MNKEEKTPANIARSLMKDPLYRTHFFLYAGLGINLLYAVVKLVSGGRVRAPWLVVLGIYYIVLAVMRFSVLKSVRQKPFGADLPGEFRRYRLCGVILLGMNIVLAILVAAFVVQRQQDEKSLIRLILMAAYAFYTLIIAAVNLIRFRKYGSPLLSSAKVISLTAALVTMLTLEVSMIDSLTAEPAARFRLIMLSASGAVICAWVLGMAIYMIVRGTVHLNQLQNLEKGS